MSSRVPICPHSTRNGTLIPPHEWRRVFPCRFDNLNNVSLFVFRKLCYFVKCFFQCFDHGSLTPEIRNVSLLPFCCLSVVYHYPVIRAMFVLDVGCSRLCNSPACSNQLID